MPAEAFPSPMIQTRLGRWKERGEQQRSGEFKVRARDKKDLARDNLGGSRPCKSRPGLEVGVQRCNLPPLEEEQDSSEEISRMVTARTFVPLHELGCR